MKQQEQHTYTNQPANQQQRHHHQSHMKHQPQLGKVEERLVPLTTDTAEDNNDKKEDEKEDSSSYESSSDDAEYILYLCLTIII
jgi:hypothetical protein